MDSLFGGLGIVPGVGDVASGAEAAYRYKQGDMLGAGLAGLGALPLMPNVAGMFIGKGAKTWDAVKASQAMEMADKGVDPRTIWKETGNWKAPDGKWRQEIPDDISQRVNPIKETKPAGWYPNTIGEYARSPVVNAYPDIGNVKINTDALYTVDPFARKSSLVRVYKSATSCTNPA